METHTSDSPPLRPGIRDDTIALAKVRCVTALQSKALCRLEADGLWIPYHDCDGRPVSVDGKPFGRLRLAKPVDERKYHQAAGTTVHAYLPPHLAHAAPGGDLVLVEGEFKALSLMDAGIAAVGLPGLYAVLEDRILPELSAMLDRLRPERILFLGDSDTFANPFFSDAAVKLARAVTPIPVALPRIGLDAPGKGVDDCRQALGGLFPQWWLRIMADALPLPPKTSVPEIAARLVDAAQATFPALDVESKHATARKLARLCAFIHKDPLSAARIADIAHRALGIPKRAFNEAVKVQRKEIRDQAREQLDVAPDKSSPGPITQYTGETPELVARYGQPVFIRTNEDGSVSDLQINQNYWAGLFAEENDVLFEPDEREFYVYEKSSGLWVPGTDAAIMMQLSERLLAASRHPMLTRLEQLRCERTLSAICKLSKGVCERREAFSKHERHYIHALNGVIEITPDEILLREFSPVYYSRHQIPIRFDPDARCDRFLKELIFPAMSPADAQLLQLWFGSVILHRNLAQRLLILGGEAGRGKSQLANVAQGLAGRHNCAGLRTDLLGERFELFRLRRKTLLAAADVPGRFLLSPGATTLKALVGGDYLDAEAKNLNANFPIKGDFNVIITCNERLRIRIENDTGAWRRRLLIINFEAPPPKLKVPNFAELLLEEEGPGILNWALVGADKLLRQIRETGDFVLDPVQRGRIDSLLAESESLRLFVQHRVARASGASLPKEAIIEAYGEYCAEHSWDPMPLHLVQKRLPELMLEVHQASQSRSIQIEEAGRSRSVQGYRGVKLTNTTTNPS